MPRRVVASTYVSLDGYIDEPGKWSLPFWSQEAAEFKAKELFSSDALLLGRLTYEGFAAAWPTMQGTGEFGEKMNSMPKHVASRTLKSATWECDGHPGRRRSRDRGPQIPRWGRPPHWGKWDPH